MKPTNCTWTRAILTVGLAVLAIGIACTDRRDVSSPVGPLGTAARNQGVDGRRLAAFERTGEGCAVSQTDAQGVRRAVAVPRAQLPFSLPRISRSPVTGRGTGHVSQLVIKPNGSGTPLTFTCWLPDTLAPAQLSRLVGNSLGDSGSRHAWAQLRTALGSAPVLPKAQDRAPLTAEAQAFVPEMIDSSWLHAPSSGAHSPGAPSASSAAAPAPGGGGARPLGTWDNCFDDPQNAGPVRPAVVTRDSAKPGTPHLLSECSCSWGFVTVDYDYNLYDVWALECVGGSGGVDVFGVDITISVYWYYEDLSWDLYAWLLDNNYLYYQNGGPAVDSLLIKCGQNGPGGGENYSPSRGDAPYGCWVTSKSGEAVTVQMWYFTPDDPSLSRIYAPTPYNTTWSSQWPDAILTSGIVHADASLGNQGVSADRHVSVLPRTGAFHWNNPVTNGTVPANCSSYFRDFWGWTAPAGTCNSDNGVLSPDPYTTTDIGVTVTQVSSGLNNGLYYVTGFSSGVNVGSDWIPELKGAGALYNIRHDDPGVGGCVSANTTTLLAPINTCKGTPVTAVGNALNAHEACHRQYDAQAFTNLNATSGSAVKVVPDSLELLVNPNSAALLDHANILLRRASDAIIVVGHNALDYATGTGIPMWGPEDSTSTYWSALSWDEVRSC